MPWHSEADVARHNKAAAGDSKKAEVWKKVANESLAKYGDASAIRIANSAVKHMNNGGAAEVREDKRIDESRPRGAGISQRGWGKAKIT